MGWTKGTSRLFNVPRASSFALTHFHNLRYLSGTVLHGLNPYKAVAGPQTDDAIQNRYFSAGVPAPSYSSDDSAAEKVRARIKAIYGYPVQTGQTKTHPRRYFARFESGPSTSTEVLADTLALAICRLALVIAAKRDPAVH